MDKCQRYSYVHGCLLVLRLWPKFHSHLILFHLIWCLCLPKYWPVHRGGGGFLGWCSAEDSSTEGRALGSLQWSMSMTPCLGRLSSPFLFCSFHRAMPTAKFHFSCLWEPRELGMIYLTSTAKGYSLQSVTSSQNCRVSCRHQF